MNPPQEKESLKEMLRKRHGWRKAELLVENLSQDGLIEDVLEILRKNKVIEELLDGYAKIAPETVARYKASRDAIRQKLTLLLDSMIRDPFYNRKILVNRLVILSGSIRRYRERISGIIELIDNILADIERDLLFALKAKAEEVLSRLKEVELLVSELNVERELFPSLGRGDQLLDRIMNSSHLGAYELIANLKAIEKLETELSTIKTETELILEDRRRVERLIQENKSLIAKLNQIHASINQNRVRTPFIRELIDRNITLIKSIEEKGLGADITDITEKIAALEVTKKELLECLKDSQKIMTFIAKLKKIEETLPKLLKISLFLDSTIGTGFFEELYCYLTERLRLMKRQQVFNSRDEFIEIDKKLNTIENLVADLLTIGGFVRELTSTSEELRSLAGIEGWRDEIRRISAIEAPREARLEEISSHLSNLSKRLRTWRRKFEDVEKMYPIWRKRIIEELSTRREIALDEIAFIPKEWREFVLSRMRKEGVIEERAGFFTLKRGALKSKQVTQREQLLNRISRIKTKIEEIYRLPTLGKRERGMLNGIIMKLEDIENRVKAMENEIGLKGIRKELSNLEAILEVFLTEVEGGILN